jgi:hypothetical protein
MRPSHAVAVAVALALVSSAVSHAQGQMAPPRAGQGYGEASAAAAPGAPSLPRRLARAALLIAMAQSAPAAAPTVAAARRSASAARAAAAMYEAGLTDYEAGYLASADSAAGRAIGLAELAVSAAFGEHSNLIEASSGGDLASTAPVANSFPATTTAGTGRMLRLSTTYAGIVSLPFGVIPAGPPAPPLPYESLPFGVIPVR